MLLHGADPKALELRPTALKAAMRYWWRALHPTFPNGKALYRAESKIFGGTWGNDEGNQAVFSLRIENPEVTTDVKEKLLPHKSNFQRAAYQPQDQFDVVITARPNPPIDLPAMLNLAGILGGVGQRSRRGFGNFMIADEWKNAFIGLSEIEQLIGKLNPDAELSYDATRHRIIVTHQKNCLPIPYLESVELGHRLETHKGLIAKTSQATHDYLGRDRSSYQNSIGAAEPRFASPVWVSGINSGRYDGRKIRSLVSRVHAVPPKNRTPDPAFQDHFIRTLTARPQD